MSKNIRFSAVIKSDNLGRENAYNALINERSMSQNSPYSNLTSIL